MNDEMNNQYPYNQPPMEEMPPQPQIPVWQRSMNGMKKIQSLFPKWLTQYSIVAYILALAVVSFMYSDYSLPWYYMLSGVVAFVVFFFYGSYLVNDRLSIDRVHRRLNFEKKIFWIAFILRVIWMFLIYTIFMQNYGNAFGFENMDAIGYDDLGQFVARLIEAGNYHFYDEISRYIRNDDLADMGYGVYVGLVYWMTGSSGVATSYGLGGDISSIVVLRLIKCLLSAFTVLLIYRLAKRNFGDQTARIAAVFCALWPNFWYYCGTHLKETEMVFLVVMFVEQADQMLRSRQFTAWKVAPILLVAALLFTFRTVLALVCLMALIFTIVMSSTRVVNWGKRIVIGGLAITFIMLAAGNQIQEQASELISKVEEGEQKGNMEWRAERKDVTGTTQSFAKYAGFAVFAPMIFTLPFPTLVRPFDDQDLQQMLNGSNFLKNIISFFTIVAIVMLFLSGKWREHLLPLSLLIGYLIVLSMSSFAHSERFHQPAMPFEFMFAAYGLSIAVTKPKYKRWFMYWCGVMFVAAIAWNWFKLAGRGMV